MNEIICDRTKRSSYGGTIKEALNSMPISVKRRSSQTQYGVNCTLHYVHFVKYDVTVSFDDAVSDTIRRRGGDRGIFTEEGVDTVAYFGGNHGFRV